MSKINEYDMIAVSLGILVAVLGFHFGGGILVGGFLFKLGYILSDHVWSH